MTWHHPTYYRKQRAQRAASTRPNSNDLLDAENAERFVESAKPQAKRAQPEVASDKRQATSFKRRAKR